MAASSDPARERRPWGRITALLGACAATLIGIGCGLEPEVILVRAIGSGLLLGLVAWGVGLVIDQFLQTGG